MAPIPCLGQPAGAVLTSIETVFEGGVTIVTIQSDGPLPEAEANILDGPPRIYFDLSGVRPRNGRPSVAKGAGIVSRVRIAPRSVNPHVTRVVLDLTRLQDYQVQSGERQEGRIVIQVGSRAALRSSSPTPEPPPVDREPAAPEPVVVPADPPPPPPPPEPVAEQPKAPPAIVEPSAPEATPPDLPRSPVAFPETRPRPALPAGEADVYRMQLGGTLERITAQRAVLRLIDAGENIAAETLTAAANDFRDLRRILERVEPSSVVRPTHDLLISSCTLGGQAVSLQMEAAAARSADRQRNASSAAAGALMLLDLVCTSIGCDSPR
jgi:hypothetical protein